jgi:hypothetical protein
LQRQLQGEVPVNLASVTNTSAETGCDAETPTETILLSLKVSPRQQIIRRPTLRKRARQPYRPTIVAGRRLNRRVRPKQVVRPPPTRQKWSTISQKPWILDALELFQRQCELEDMLGPHVRRCGRTVPPSSRGGHWLLPQGAFLICLSGVDDTGPGNVYSFVGLFLLSLSHSRRIVPCNS